MTEQRVPAESLEKTVAPSTPLDQTNTDPIKKSKSRLIFSTIAIVTVLVGLYSAISRQDQNDPSLVDTPENITNPITPTPEILLEEGTDEDFVILFRGDLKKTESGYEFIEEFEPLLEPFSPDEHEETSYVLTVTMRDGTKETYYFDVNYCTYTGGDYCEPADFLQETATNTTTSVDSFPVLVTPETVSFSINIEGTLVKTITKTSTIPRINNLTIGERERITNNEKEIVDVVLWDINPDSAERSMPFAAYRTSSTTWRVRDDFIRDNSSTRELTVDKKVYTTFDEVYYRILETDGFYLTYKDIRPFELLGTKELNLSIEGIRDGMTIGLNGHVNGLLSFTDPETGWPCGGKGCLSEINKEMYEVTWSSDKQTIGSDEFVNGIFSYYFKSYGEHTITVTVQHKQKPTIRAEKSFTVTVVP